MDQNIHSGICHGTLGELLQGPFIVDDELHISLISLPIKKYSMVHFFPGKKTLLNTSLLGKEKSHKAIEIYLSIYQKILPEGEWMYDSELIQGKGMASSTADIVATIRCLDSLFAQHSSAQTIAAILSNIERSDSVFLDTYALYLSSKQTVIQYLNDTPKFYVCYIDEGNLVDTEKVGKSLLSYYEAHLSSYLSNLKCAIHAFVRHDLLQIARCSTTSALLSQGILPKKNLDILLSCQSRYKADGIVVAHTGSLLGYLYIQKPSCAKMGELSSFFRSLGYPCRFIQSGF